MLGMSEEEVEEMRKKVSMWEVPREISVLNKAGKKSLLDMLKE